MTSSFRQGISYHEAENGHLSIKANEVFKASKRCHPQESYLYLEITILM